jgi:DNA-binding PucR family transcriptional regulator
VLTGEVLDVLERRRAPLTSALDSHEMLLASIPAPVLRSFRERLLGPLAEYDARRGAELLPTLRSFLACDGSWTICAARMYVHVNTVRYRISRIEALTGRDLSALPDRVDFFLALRGGT